MNISPIDIVASRRIGAVDFVSTAQIIVVLDIEAPHSIVATAGTPTPFPRINSYLLIPTESGQLVGRVESVTIEHSPNPQLQGNREYGLVDLPFPLRRMKVNPLGMLEQKDSVFTFKRGVDQFPSVGQPVLIPTDKQLRAISESGTNRRVRIGTSPMASNADVVIDPDRLFGRHLAILGNTGSGKSCSVAGLIRWSLDAASESIKNGNEKPNARFIVLDPNGEYSNVFGEKARVFQVGNEDNCLQVPLWFWNSTEWCTFTQASARSQVPLLKQALRTMRNNGSGSMEDERIDNEIRRFLRNILTTITHEKNIGTPWDSFPKTKHFLEKICKWQESIEYFRTKIESNDTRLDALNESLLAYKDDRSGTYPTLESTFQNVCKLIDEISTAHGLFGGLDRDLVPINEDVPIKFKGEDFVHFLEVLIQDSGYEQYMDFFLTRVRTMLADTRMKNIIGDDANICLADWLNSYIGKEEAENACVTIIDLSLVPSEISHVITAVIARMVLEALQRYKKLMNHSLPTVMVMEEAHNFVSRYQGDAENQSAGRICCQAFEKIAREGRKFGLGLVISSQRPYELSPTVLSQCNTFLLHRVSNDMDQRLIRELVPDNLSGLLDELPSMPSQQAILLGWASELPVIVRMGDLPEEHRPSSDDPDYWDVWSRNTPRDIDWEKIARDWQRPDV